jgi:two-component system sensor histidine kinase HydH
MVEIPTLLNPVRERPGLTVPRGNRLINTGSSGHIISRWPFAIFSKKEYIFVKNVFKGDRVVRRKRLYIPIIAILASILTLLSLLGISTVRNLHRDRVRMEESLFRNGMIVLRGLEASYRFTIRHMTERRDTMQRLISQVSDLTEIHFIALVDENGKVLADSDDALVGTTYPEREKLANLIAGGEPQRWFAADGSFIVAKRFQPFRPPPLGMGEHGPMHPMREFRRAEPSLNLPDKTYAIVGLDTTLFKQEQKKDLQYALMLGIVLLIVGSVSLYVIVLVQNYTLVNRTLDTMTTYTTNVVEHMPDGLVAIDARGGIVTVNHRAAEIFALKAKAPSDERRELTKKFQGFAKPLLDDLIREKTIIEREVVYSPEKGKPVPLSVSATKLIADDGEDLGAVFILRDMREIKELQERVTRSERLAALGELAAGVAHEIRNPLSSIKGFAQFFLKKNPLESTDHKYSEVMLQEVERLDRVISSLLDYAKPKEPIKAKTSLAAIIRRCTELIQDDAQAKQVAVNTEIADGLPLVFVDKDQMTQVVLNIALNGLDAMEGGGRLVLRCFQERKSIIMEIEDTGHGIPPDELPRIFNPFYTTKQTGTGLGLALAHRIIENHAGTLSVKATGPAGTTFRIVLPR